MSELQSTVCRTCLVGKRKTSGATSERGLEVNGGGPDKPFRLGPAHMIMSASGVRREGAAFQWVQTPPGNCSSNRHRLTEPSLDSMAVPFLECLQKAVRSFSLQARPTRVVGPHDPRAMLFQAAS